MLATSEERGRAHRLPATPDTVCWGWLPCAEDAPVLAVDPGASVAVDTVSHEGILEDQGRDPVAFFGGHGVPADAVLADAITVAAQVDHDPGAGPHVVTGPIEVRGARPGDCLAVRVDRLTPRAGYGVISSRHGKGLLPDTFPAAPGPTSIFCRVDGDHAVLPVTDDPHAPVARFPLAPFLGVMGVATPGADRRDSVAPGEFGGNIDIALLCAGSVLYLPVLVPGAGFYVGDPHYAQGNGEIALTALEAPLHAELTIDLIPAGRVRELFGAAHGPIVRTSEFLVPTGLDPDLDAAVADCGRNAVALLGAAFGMAPERAYAYLSAAADFDISQVVDIVKGAHARIRMADFATVRELPWR